MELVGHMDALRNCQAIAVEFSLLQHPRLSHLWDKHVTTYERDALDVFYHCAVEDQFQNMTSHKRQQLKSKEKERKTRQQLQPKPIADFFQHVLHDHLREVASEGDMISVSASLNDDGSSQVGLASLGQRLGGPADGALPLPVIPGLFDAAGPDAEAPAPICDEEDWSLPMGTPQPAAVQGGPNISEHAATSRP